MKAALAMYKALALEHLQQLKGCSNEAHEERLRRRADRCLQKAEELSEALTRKRMKRKKKAAEEAAAAAAGGGGEGGRGRSAAKAKASAN